MSQKATCGLLHRSKQESAIAVRGNVGSTSCPLGKPDMKEAHPDSSHLYEVERRVEHAVRPGFRILEFAALADAEGALAQPHQYLRYFLRSGRTREAVLAGPKRGSESEARRSLCSQTGATASGDQRWREIAHVSEFTRCG